MNITTRKQAKAANLTFYFTGNPCKHGHVDVRLVASATCIQCAKAIKQKHLSSAENVEKHKQYCRDYYAKNKEKISAQNAGWRVRNKARLKQIRDAYYQSNKTRYSAANKKRKVSIIQRVPAWANLSAIEAFYVERDMLTAQTGIVHHVDHIIPLQGRGVCGLHVETNLQVIPASVNLKKGNRQ